MQDDVRSIINAINKNGRQGPKDLKSHEVYSWVKEEINISYDDYLKILLDNAIFESERSINRNAYFVRCNNETIQLFKSNEEEMRKYACYIVSNNPKITSKEALKKFKDMYQDYTLVDLMIQQNLTSDQEVIDQTFRNILVSNYFKYKNNILFNRSETKPFKYTITDVGRELALSFEMSLKDNINQSLNDEIIEDNDILTNLDRLSYYTDLELEEIKEANKNFDIIKVIEKYGKDKENFRFPTDAKLRLTRFVKTNFKCECNSRHETFKTSLLPQFMVGHHLVPMAAQKTFYNTNLDCIENLFTLCPNCHFKIHYGTREAKREVFDILVKKREKELASIGFTKETLNVIFDMYY